MSQRFTRRTLLGRTALSGAGLLLAGVGVQIGRASPNEKLGIACIGLGNRGAANVGGVSGENVAALCDVDDQTAGNMYQRFPKARKYYDYRMMLEEMDRQIDAVVVSTPDHTHAHPSVMALRMGKHLYLEKPLAHSLHEARLICDIARERKLATQLGAQRHVMDNMHRVVELIQSGAIGEVKEVHSWIDKERGMPALPKDRPEVRSTLKWDLWLGPARERPYSPEYVPYKWRFWWDFGTGETGNWACHILDIPYWALKLKYPTKVRAEGPPLHAETTPRSMTCHFQFPARGDLPPVELHWYHTKDEPEAVKSRGLKLDRGGANNLFIGTEGMLLCGFDNRKLFPEEKYRDFKPPENTVPDSPGFYREWIDACKGGPPATCNFEYSGPMAETALLGNLAYRLGEEMEWDAERLMSPNCPVADLYIKTPYRKGWEL